MIPRFKPTLGWQEFLAVLTPSRKDEVERFERDFAQLMGQKHAIAFPYGRTGLTLLLEAMGLEDKDVICPAYTCVVVPHAIVTSGNKPVFVDSQEEDFNMNLNLVPQVITENTGAIIATSIFGYPVNLDQLDQIRQQYPHIRIIQDCAHSFAAEWKGRPVQREGDAAIFGLNISKIITSIFGGMVTTDRDDLADKLRQLREKRLESPSWQKALKRRLYLMAIYPAFNHFIYGITNALERSGLLDRFVKYYDEGVIDMPSDYLVGMTRVEAKVGQIQVKRYHNIIRKRCQIAALYDLSLKDISNFQLPPLIKGATYSHYVARVPKKEKLLKNTLRSNIQLGQIIEYCIPKMQSYQSYSSSFSNANQMSKTVINLPLSINSDEFSSVICALKKVLKNE